MTYCKNYCEEEGISTSKLNEAQRTLYYIAENMKMDKSISKEGYRHFQMAIKLLEQEPILDKIRAEIENHCGLAKENRCKYCSYCNSVMGVREILKIIDKYKAESEE